MVPHVFLAGGLVGMSIFYKSRGGVNIQNVNNHYNLRSFKPRRALDKNVGVMGYDEWWRSKIRNFGVVVLKTNSKHMATYNKQAR